MATPLLNQASVMLCSHGASAATVPSQARVLVMNTPALTVADQTTIAGCPFTPGSNPLPCLTVRWTAPATRVLIGGVPALLQSSVGLGLNPSQAPQGPLNKVAVQPRVKAV